MRHRFSALAAIALLALTACATPATHATDDALVLAERARVLAPRSGDATSEKSNVDPATAVAASMGATAIAAPSKAFKDAQNSTTGNVQTGFMLGGATDSQLAFVNGLIERDKSLQSIGAQIDALLFEWQKEGGQTAERATQLTELRAAYEVRFDRLSSLGQAAMPAKVDLSKLVTLGVFNWSSGYAVGAEQKPMSRDEALAAGRAAVATWQGIKAIATQDADGVVDGGPAPSPEPDDAE